jgi:hypothetical protein
MDSLVERLNQKLTETCKKLRVDTASLGIWSAATNQPQFLEYGAAQNQISAQPVPVLCCVKLLTCALTLLLCKKHDISLQEKAASLLPQTNLSNEFLQCLGDTTLLHLLAHTHGLGGTLLETTPFNAQDMIDGEKVYAAIAAEGRLFESGKYYGYGISGYVLLGMVIEQLCQAPYARILYEELLSPLGGGELPQVENICPSAGASLALSPQMLMNILAPFFQAESAIPHFNTTLFAAMRHNWMPLPGWSPLLHGCCLGWKDFGHGWQGHNGIGRHSVCVLRVNPEQGMAWVLAASSQIGNAGSLPFLLFQNEFSNLGFSLAAQPKMRAYTSQECAREIVGLYGSECQKFRIFMDGHQLKLEISTRDEQQRFVKGHECTLYPAANDLFCLTKPRRNTTFIQRVIATDGSTVGLWDHNQLWPKYQEKILARK